jgi:hypothetical protein
VIFRRDLRENNMKQMQRLLIGIVLSTAIGLVLLPAVRASSITISANPSSGTIYNFPAAGIYENFYSNLTVSGAVTGTPTWSYAPAPGSPSCAIHIFVTFANVHAWNTSATFDDTSIYGCGATINLTVSSTTGLTETIGVSVRYVFCAHCT